MRIVYHEHSGFSVQTGKHLLIFDYLGKGLSAPQRADRALAFVSHSHRDHFHPSVVRWMEEERVCLFVGDDVTAGGLRMKPGDVARVGDAQIEAFESTDQGVSFLVQADGVRIFHAGDLNLWHWKNESDEEYVRQATEAFEAALERLRGRRIDVAFFPVDPRMGDGHEAGAMRFIEVLQPGHFIPMHFWDQPQAALNFARNAFPDGVTVHALTEPGQSIEL